VRDLPCFEYLTTVVIELYRVRCLDCGLKIEKVDQLPSKAPFSKRFEEAVGEACESASARRVAKQCGLAQSRFEPSICAIWSAGARHVRSPPYDRWERTRSFSERRRNS
jgi:hypothetical protein